MKLTNDQRERLQSALNEMCAVKADVNKLTFPVFGQAVDKITTSTGGVGDLLRAVVSEAEKRQSGVGGLINAAIVVLEKGPPKQLLPATHPLKQLRSELGDLIFEEQQDPLAACWLLGDRVLIDRQDLRAKVSALGRPTSGKHILVVQSKEKRRGRTWSRELITYFRDRQGGFQMIFADLEKLAELNDDRDLLPEDLGQEIADQMGLGKVPERQNEKDAKWANRFCNWLTPFVQGTDKQYWIVLDSFDKRLLPQGIYDLVGAIAERIEITLGQLRLVLLSYDQAEKLEANANVQGGLEVEDIASQIGPPEVAEFFFQLYEERKKRKSVPYTDPDVATSVQAVLQAVDPSSEQYLQELHKEVLKVAKPIRADGGGS